MKKTLFAMLLLITIALSVTIVACSNEVKKVAVTGVTLNKETTTITATDNEKLVATIEPANASNKKVTWSSSNTNVATVDANGLVTAITSGTSVITVKTEDGGFEDFCTVTVVPAPIPVDSVTVSPTTLNLTVGSTGKLEAKISPTDASVQTITWSSNNENVAAVSNGVVTAIAAGNATITATAGGKTGSCTVSVSAEDNNFCFTAREAGVAIYFDEGDGKTGFTPSLKYKTNSDWVTYTTGTIITLANDEKVYFKAGKDGNTSFCVENEIEEPFWWQFFTTGAVDVSGNIMYLLDENANKTTLSDCCFENLFSGCSIVNAKDLSLPVPTLSKKCYQGLFGGCTSLTNAPALPATTLAEGCYKSMFDECTSLEKAPALPAENLGAYCYAEMFYYCTSLTDMPSLPATELTEGCYSSMFEECEGLTTISATLLPSTKLANSCYESMFSDCTSLKNVPELPATSLTDCCYKKMFSGCEGLTTITDNLLQSTKLANNCYDQMFGSCTGLTTLPAGLLPAQELVKECYNFMFFGCTGLKTVPVNLLQSTSLAEGCYSNMFNWCTNLTSALELPAINLKNKCYYCMFNYCENLKISKDSGDHKIFTCPSLVGLTDPVSGMFDNTADPTLVVSPGSGDTFYWNDPDPE